MAEWIYILFGVEIPGDPRNIVLDGVYIRHGEGEVVHQITLPVVCSSVCSAFNIFRLPSVV